MPQQKLGKHMDRMNQYEIFGPYMDDTGIAWILPQLVCHKSSGHGQASFVFFVKALRVALSDKAMDVHPTSDRQPIIHDICTYVYCIYIICICIYIYIISIYVYMFIIYIYVCVYCIYIYT